MIYDMLKESCMAHDMAERKLYDDLRYGSKGAV